MTKPTTFVVSAGAVLTMTDPQSEQLGASKRRNASSKKLDVALTQRLESMDVTLARVVNR